MKLRHIIQTCKQIKRLGKFFDKYDQNKIDKILIKVRNTKTLKKNIEWSILNALILTKVVISSDLFTKI